jgi:hypothetical protein
MCVTNLSLATWQVQLGPGEAVTFRLYTVDSDDSDSAARPAVPVLSLRLLPCHTPSHPVSSQLHMQQVRSSPS